jgi:hypothetical protein
LFIRVFDGPAGKYCLLKNKENMASGGPLLKSGTNTLGKGAIDKKTFMAQ